jgi:hypothetical protein
MLYAVPLFFAIAISQEPKKPAEPPGDDEVVVRGLPDGEAPPRPERVDWDLTKAIVARTATRQRINLAGFWRFAPVLERNAAVARGEMGWIEMPRLGGDAGQTVFDARFRAIDGLWRGKPLERYSHVWVERDINIPNNMDSLKWLDRRIYLVLRGPWIEAETYTSQRIPITRPAEGNVDEQPGVHVHAEPVTGVDRDGFRWCEITEQLIYPGTTQISMRLKRNGSGDDEKSATTIGSEPFVGLELAPTGPRIESIRLRRDSERGEIEVTLDLVRPKGFMLIPVQPVRTIPVTLKLRLDDADADKNIQRLDKDIGPIADNERTVTLRIPWSASKDAPPPTQAAFRVRLGPTVGGVFDEAFPVTFKPADLEPVD